MTSFGVLRDVRFSSLNLFRWRHWLKNSGYKTKLQYQQPTERKENVTSTFKPSYSRSVKNNFGRIFIKLISKYFLKNHQLINFFNKNAIKLSHSCIPNLWSKINGHKKKTTTQAHRNTKIMQLLCYRKLTNYSIGLYLTSNTLYQPTLKCNDSK